MSNDDDFTKAARDLALELKLLRTHYDGHDDDGEPNSDAFSGPEIDGSWPSELDEDYQESDDVSENDSDHSSIPFDDDDLD